jgi:hypothetical protein
MTETTRCDYYVYLHTRADGVVFYVGKGRGKRSTSTKNRNPHWAYVVAKHGGFEATIVASGLTEKDAIEKEAELIASHRKFGFLTNILDRGDIAPSSHPDVAKKISLTLTGIKRSEETKAKLKAVFRTQEWRENMSKAAKGKILSEETRKKISASSSSRTASEETRILMSEKAKLRSMSHLQTPEIKKLASDKNAFRGKKRPDHSKFLKSLGSFKGENNPFYGKGHLQLGAKNRQAKPVNGIHIYFGAAQWETLTSAANCLGVTTQAISQAMRNNGRSKGWRLEMAS